MNRRLAVLLAMLAGSSAARAAGPFSVRQLAAPGLQTARMSKQLSDLCNEHLAQALNDQGLKVISQAQIGVILGMERQKQLLGCSDSTSCVLELTNALGADAVVVGSVGLVGESFQVDVKITASRDGSTLATYSGRVAGEEAMLDELGKAAVAIAQKLTVAPKAPVASGGGHAGSIVAGVAALVFAGGGAYLGLQAQSNAAVVRKEAKGGDFTAFTSAQTALKWQAPAADGLFAAGVLAAGAAIVLFATSSSAPAVAVVPGPGSGAVVVGGTF